MKIYTIYGRNYDSNVFLVTGENITVIDAGTGLFGDYMIKEIKRILGKNDLKQIILTHEHFDHVGGIKNIINSFNENINILAHPYAAEKIESGKSMFAKMLGAKMPNIKIDIKLDGKDIVKIGDNDFEVIHTPGHTPGSICLYDRFGKNLFSGDTVFSHGSFGRYDFPGGDGKTLRRSIELLSKLDVENIYPGHETIVEGDGNRHMDLCMKNTEYLK